MMEVVQTHIIPTDEFIDEDVLRAMNSLGCFKDKEKLKQELLQPVHNTGNHDYSSKIILAPKIEYRSELFIRFQ